MLPSSSLELASQWQCLGVQAQGLGCGAVMEADVVVSLEEQVEKALEEVRIRISHPATPWFHKIPHRKSFF